MSGYVRVYHLERSDDGFSWKQVGQNITGEEIEDEFGNSVSLSDDGITLAVSTYLNDGNGTNSGRVLIYHLGDDGSSWKQLGQEIDGDAPLSDPGTSVSLSANGTIVAIGEAWNSDNGIHLGRVRIY